MDFATASKERTKNSRKMKSVENLAHILAQIKQPRRKIDFSIGQGLASFYVELGGINSECAITSRNSTFFHSLDAFAEPMVKGKPPAALEASRTSTSNSSNSFEARTTPPRRAQPHGVPLPPRLFPSAAARRLSSSSSTAEERSSSWPGTRPPLPRPPPPHAWPPPQLC